MNTSTKATLAHAPCLACTYRKDVASGVWAAEEYAKLPPYDAPTGEQPIGLFMCHACPDNLCHGWAVCHSNRGRGNELLALRLFAPELEIPEPVVALFESGEEAAKHGLKDIEKPKSKAKKTIKKLKTKYKRLRE